MSVDAFAKPVLEYSTSTWYIVLQVLIPWTCTRSTLVRRQVDVRSPCQDHRYHSVVDYGVQYY